MTIKDKPLPSPGPKEYWEDSKWASEHFGEIVKDYPDQWVAIVNRKVVAAGRTIAEVEDKAKRKTGLEEFPIYFAERTMRVYQNKQRYKSTIKINLNLCISY